MGLTVRQREILHFLAERERERGVMPSQTVVGRALGVSQQAVSPHYKALLAEGCIEPDPEAPARGVRYRLTQKGRGLAYDTSALIDRIGRILLPFEEDPDS